MRNKRKEDRRKGVSHHNVKEQITPQSLAGKTTQETVGMGRRAVIITHLGLSCPENQGHGAASSLHTPFPSKMQAPSCKSSYFIL